MYSKTASLAKWYDTRRESGRTGFDPDFHRGAFAGSSHTTDLKTGIPEAILPGVWRFTVSIDWLARCQYVRTKWYSKLGLQLLSQYVSTSEPVISE